MLIRVFNDPYDTIIKAGDTRKRGRGVRNEVERKEREQARGGGQAGRQAGRMEEEEDGRGRSTFDDSSTTHSHKSSPHREPKRMA